jgi:YD repeat-containing protein
MTDTGTGSGNPTGTVVTTQAWDASSRLVAETDPGGHTTTYAYDPCDRRITATHADSTVRTSSWDAHGNEVMSNDPNGTLVLSSYDASDRLIFRTITPGPGVSADTTFEIYAYHGRSRLVLAQDGTTTRSSRAATTRSATRRRRR